MRRGRITASASKWERMRRVMHVCLSLLISVIMFVSATNLAFAHPLQQQKIKEFSIENQVSKNCYSEDGSTKPHSSGICAGHTCCILNSSQDLDKFMSSIAILPMLILILSIKSSTQLVAIKDINLNQEYKIIDRCHFAQPPPVI